MSAPRLIYIAGPMRGVVGWNYEAFDEAEIRMRAAGWWPINPARTSRALGYRPDDDGDQAHHDVYLRHVMAVDVASIMQCSAIALLPGWERSLGSTVELALAQFLQLTVYCAITLEVIAPGFCPWQHTWNYTGLQGDGSGEAYANIRPRGEPISRPGPRPTPREMMKRIDEMADIAAGVPPGDVDKLLRGYDKVVCWYCDGKGTLLGAAPDRCNPQCTLCGGTGLVNRPFTTGGTS